MAERSKERTANIIPAKASASPSGAAPVGSSTGNKNCQLNLVDYLHLVDSYGKIWVNIPYMDSMGIVKLVVCGPVVWDSNRGTS